jgi:hypothetical protein
MITLEQYLMGRDKEHPINMVQARNAANLLARVNWVFATLGICPFLSSGYRPQSINKSVGGAKMSTHTMCAGIDVFDRDKAIANAILNRVQLLEECGLWLENPDYTKTWVHLDIKVRKNRIFIP